MRTPTAGEDSPSVVLLTAFGTAFGKRPALAGQNENTPLRVVFYSLLRSQSTARREPQFNSPFSLQKEQNVLENSGGSMTPTPDPSSWKSRAPQVNVFVSLPQSAQGVRRKVGVFKPGLDVSELQVKVSY